MLMNGKWKKSSFSNGSGGNNCVEVRGDGYTGGAYVRHSEHPEGQPLDFTADEWAAFVKGVKAGEFDPAPPYADIE